MISKIGFIGAGKVGTSLGKYFSEKDIQISGYYSKTKAHSVESADFTNSLFFNKPEDLIKVSNMIFITVSDGEISHVWNQIKDMDLSGKSVIHCSGAMSSIVFDGAKDRGANAFSLHPMCSVNSRTESWQDLGNAYFTIEGDEDGMTDMMELMNKAGNHISKIDKDAKTKYHAASVFVSNLVIGLAAASEGLFRDCGLDEDFSQNAWHSLFMVNAENIVNNGFSGALTGPVERADHITVKKHLESLEGSDLIIYKELSRMILDIAKGKHPQRDYTKIDKELLE